MGREALPQVMDSNVLEEETVEALVALFGFLGYEECSDDRHVEDVNGPEYGDTSCDFAWSSEVFVR